MARWYLTAFTTGKRYPLFNALKKIFILKSIADRHTYLGEYKYQEGFDRTFKECVELVRDIHEIDPINGLDNLRKVLAVEKYRAKNNLPDEHSIGFYDLEYKDHFPESLYSKEKEDMDLLKEMVEDSKNEHSDESEDEEKHKPFYERVKNLAKIIRIGESQSSKFDEYNCDPKYWS